MCSLLVVNLQWGTVFVKPAFVVPFCSGEQTAVSIPALHPYSDIPLVRDSSAALHLPLCVAHTLAPSLFLLCCEQRGKKTHPKKTDVRTRT